MADESFVSGETLFTFAVIADTHTAETEGGHGASATKGGGDLTNARSRYVVDCLNALDPDFVVHLGDITHPNPISSAYDDSAAAFRRIFGRLVPPLHLVPGNHDVGEKASKAIPMPNGNYTVRTELVRLYEKAFGPQFYNFVHGGCLFVVVNGQLFNSGDPDERRQAEWLERVLVTNAGKRIFVFSHYPPFLSRASEAPHYDAIDEPARSWLLSLFEEAKVEAHYAGHVHNLFFGTHCKTNHYVLPSTSFVRHDFHEFFRVAPDDEEGGRFDTDKLGFYLVDVHERGHVNHFVRTRGRCLGDGEAFDPQTLTSHGLHSWTRSVPTVGLDLRSPWCEEATIPTTFGTEIFGRKRLRNDYPVHCLWELGVRHLRLPLDDLTDHRVRTRMCELAAFGHRFSVVSFGVPSVEGIRVISANPSVVSRLEVFAPILDARSALSGLAASRSLSPTAVLFGRFRDEEGFSASQGFHVGETDLATSVLSTAESEGAHVGIVFSVAPSESPIESASIAADFAAKTGVPVTLNVPFGFDDEMSLEDRQASDLNRTLQGALAAILYPGLIVHIDNFTTLDRGYFRAIGLFDRLFNPQVGAASLKTLHRVFAEPVLSRPWTKLDGGFGVPVSWGNRHGVLVVPRDWQTGVALDWAAIGTLDDSHPELIEFANGTTTNDTARLVGGRIGRPVLLHA